MGRAASSGSEHREINMFSYNKIVTGVLLFGASNASPADKILDEDANKNLDGEKRYAQLYDMMLSQNSQFDERKYWTYGCNCLMLGDRPMSQPGKGRPVDELDSVCKRYKDCIKCAIEKHGDMCLPEFVQYSVNMNRGIKCRGSAGSCDRALCECDKMFAEEHVAAKHVYSNDYHRFWSTTGFDADIDCLAGTGGQVLPKCCGKDDGAFSIYNDLTKDCCADGSIKSSGTC